MFVFPMRIDWIIAPSGRNWNGAGVGFDIVAVNCCNMGEDLDVRMEGETQGKIV